jgi:hypothetical protein
MKTNVLITRKTYLYFFIGLLGLVVSSCGSYQNSSYNDNDGVYSSNGEKNATKDSQPNSSSIQYKQYFSSLQSTGGSSDEIFTDVNSYGSDYNIENDSISTQTPSTGYASWGSSPQETTVTVYSDPFWYAGWGYPYYGYGYGYGWGYPYYGWGYPGYGWGYPGYGWGGYPGCGYPGYGYGYPHATPYAYNYSRRGSSYGGNYTGDRATPYTRNSVTSRNSVYNRNSSIVNRTSPTFTNRNSTNTARSYTSDQSRSSYSQNRASTNSSYQRSSNPSSYQRSSSSYTPSNTSSYRSSSSSSSMPSSGGARMSSGGGGGGARMGGGGRR